jgi:hypothetical protein
MLNRQQKKRMVAGELPALSWLSSGLGISSPRRPSTFGFIFLLAALAMLRHIPLTSLFVFALLTAGSSATLAQAQEPSPDDQTPAEREGQAVLVDTVYVIETQTLSKTQRSALPDSVLAEARGKQARESLAEMSTEQKAALDAVGENYTTKEVGLHYRKSSEESIDESSSSEKEITDGSTKYSEISITDAPSGKQATRVEYGWSIYHDSEDVGDVEVKLTSQNYGFTGWEGVEGGECPSYKNCGGTSGDKYDYYSETGDNASEKEAQVERTTKPPPTGSRGV